jgi:hypothetical protein
MTDFNKDMGLHDIRETLSKPIGKQFVDQLKLDWVFDKTIEKIIITGMLFWSVFSLIKFVIKLF